jgi:hypothetical protein
MLSLTIHAVKNGQFSWNYQGINGKALADDKYPFWWIYRKKGLRWIEMY